MVAKDVPIEGDKIISIKELIDQMLGYIDNKSTDIKQTNICIEWIENLFDIQLFSNSNESTGEYSQVSDMEMSLHGGSYKSDYTKNHKDKATKIAHGNENSVEEEGEDEETIVLN